MRIFIIALILFLSLIFISCSSMGPSAAGDSDELTYLAPGDAIQLDTGTLVTVDDKGILRGFDKLEPIAVGRKVRDVMKELSDIKSFERYSFVRYGERYIDVAGAVPRSGRYHFPMHEDWSMMNLLMTLNFVASENGEYLLVRHSPQFPGAYLFLRGETVPELNGIGGDDMLLNSKDRVLFPGKEQSVYVFGFVDQTVWFSFPIDSSATLSTAIDKAGGFSEKAKKNYVQIYRLLKTQQPTVLTLSWPREKEFKLEPWDIIYIP